jgi:hypothetical protein
MLQNMIPICEKLFQIMAFSEHIYSTQLKFGNARARELKPYGVWLLFSAIRKMQFSSDRNEFFLPVAIIGSNELIFFRFFLSREG